MVGVCAIWPTPVLLEAMRRLNSILLCRKKLRAISATLKRRAPCNCLVFGFGNDGAFWASINRRGVTVFLEDNEAWYTRILSSNPNLHGFLVSYQTRRTQWRALLDNPTKLALSLPPEVEQRRWDVILVDGPAGYDDHCPGRMKSIAAAVRLANPGADLFFDDCDRTVERVYCDRFLASAILVAKVDSLRHYRFESDASDDAGVTFGSETCASA